MGNGRQINFGIIGCGGISKIHAKSIKKVEGARLVAVNDIIEEKAAGFAGEYGCDYYADLNEMLKREDIDIVSICTSSGMHGNLGMAAARAGKHVIIEKPIEVSLEATDMLINACREAGVKLTCILQHRYDDSIAKLKKAVTEGKLGQLNFGASHTKWYRDQQYYDNADWRGTWELDGGGALMNQSIHYVDLLQYIMGPVDEVSGYCATRAHERIEVEDIAIAAIKFRRGAVGVIEGNTAAYPGFYTRLDIYGNDGSVIIEADDIKEWKLKCEGMETGNGINSSNSDKPSSLQGASTAAISEDSHTRQIKDFVDAVRNNKEPMVSGDDARHSLAVILAIYESSRTGKSVKIK